MRKHYPIDPATGAENQALLPWSDGVPASGTEGSYPGQALVTDSEAEILAAIDAAGLARTGGDLTELAQAISIGIFLNTFGGTANVLVAAIPGPTLIGAMPIGMQFRGVVGPVTNSGAVTVNLTGFSTAPGIKPLLRKDGISQLAPGDLAPGTEIRFWWDGTNYRYVGAVQSDTSAALGTLHTLQNMQQFKTSNRVSMSAAGANQKVVFWSPGNYTKKSPTSNLLIQAFTVCYAPPQTVGGSQNIVGFTIQNVNIGATVVPFASANGYASAVNTPTQGTNVNNSPLALVSGIAAGTYPVSMDASRSDANQWTTVFNPTSSDLQGLPAASTSILILSEIEP